MRRAAPPFVALIIHGHLEWKICYLPEIKKLVSRRYFLELLIACRKKYSKTFNDFGSLRRVLDPKLLETFVSQKDSRWVEKIIKKLFNEARECDIGFYERARLTVPGNANGTVFNSHGIRDGKFCLVLHCAGILMLSTRELKKGKNRFAENWMRMGELSTIIRISSGWLRHSDGIHSDARSFV